jgi:multicomponent Na+:H+ antiporter subunit D
MCFSQQHLKRMLALSTVSHAGLFAIGASTLDAHGLGGAAMYIAGHAGVKGALFLAAGILLNRYRSLSESRLHGAGRDIPVVGGLWLLAGLALAGLPPFGTWIGKSLVEEAAGAAGAHWVLPLAVLTSGITGAAVLRAGARVFFGWGEPAQPEGGAEQEGADEQTETEEEVPGRLPASMLAPPILLLLGSLAVGVVPSFREAAVRAGHGFASHEGYISAVLQGDSSPLELAAPVPGVTLVGIVAGLAGVLVAVLLAAFALGALRTPQWAARVLAAPVAGLRRLHSGHLGDYTAWLVLGCAALIGVLAATAP